MLEMALLTMLARAKVVAGCDAHSSDKCTRCQAIAAQWRVCHFLGIGWSI